MDSFFSWLSVIAMATGINALDISSTVTRLTRLNQTLPLNGKKSIKPVSLDRLMDFSAQRIELMARSSEADDSLVASRILESVRVYTHWENEHWRIMSRVADHRRSTQQCQQLLTSAFELIHRKSLFTHLRQNQVQGVRREQLMRHFFSGHSYSKGIIIEHGVFLRSSASLVCSSGLGTDVLRDAVFQEPLQDYERLYGAYFDAYCDQLLGSDADESQMAGSMVYSLKCDVGILRRTIFCLANKLSLQENEYTPHAE